MKGEELVTFREWRKKDNQFPDPLLDETTAVYYNFYSIGQGGLGLTTYNELPQANLKIFKRFHNVFTLAYRRFIDIELAIEKAKEAQIEAALERVRSRTMAMQNSQELKEVIRVIYEQFAQLDMFIEHTGFIVDYKTRDDMHIWLADEKGAPSEITIPYFDSPHWNSFNEAKEKGLDFFANHLNFEEKNSFYKKLFKHIPDLPEESKEFYLGCRGLAISTVLLDNVGLYMENFSGIPYSDEDNNTLMRFGKVFQQTYTRFLDLQRAEEQAREAQIEAALERVRSKAMAMHKSEDLTSSVAIVFSELDKLGFKTIRCGIGIFNDKSRKVNVWTTSSNNDTETAHLSGDEVLAGHPLLEKIYDAWQNQYDCAYTLKGKDLIDYYNYTAKSNLPVEAPALISNSTTQYYHCVMFPPVVFLLFGTKNFLKKQLYL
jgi:hypothetical protein